MILAVLREGLLSARAQKITSIVTLLLVDSMCVTVLLTSGKVEGNRQQILTTIDSAGTRSIVVRATPEAGLQSTVLEQFSAIEGIEMAIALGSAHDVHNSLIPDGKNVPLRDYWGSGLGTVSEGEAVASRIALDELGMQTGVGSVTDGKGIDVAVVGLIRDPSLLTAFEPLLLTPRAKTDVDHIGIVVIVTTHATVVGAIAEVIRPIVAGNRADQVTIETSEELAILGTTISDQLGTFGTALVAGVLTVAGLLVAVIQSALVLLKRKDWGRRRALGANRQLVMTLILTQTGIVSVAGAIFGIMVSLGTLTIMGDPAPSFVFMVAVAVLSVAVSLAASLLPAFLASRRDPIKELRVP